MLVTCDTRYDDRLLGRGLVCLVYAFNSVDLVSILNPPFGYLLLYGPSKKSNE